MLPARILHVPKLGKDRSVTEWAKHPQCHVPRGHIFQRLRLGWSDSNAVLTPVGFSLRSIEMFGEAKSITEWGRDPRTPVPAAVIFNRIYHGWEPIEAITTPLRTRGPTREAKRKASIEARRKLAREADVNRTIAYLGADPEDEGLRAHLMGVSRQRLHQLRNGALTHLWMKKWMKSLT